MFSTIVAYLENLHGIGRISVDKLRRNMFQSLSFIRSKIDEECCKIHSSATLRKLLKSLLEL